MKKLFIILAVIISTNLTAFANDPNNVVFREVTGQGSNKTEAIKNALYMAVSQVRGVKVGSGSYEFGFHSADVGVDKEQANKKKIEFDAVSVETSGTAHTTESSGLVKTYDILEEKKVDENTYQVRLKVAVYNYGATGDSNRLRIALMPIKTLAANYMFSNLTVPADALSVLLSQRLANALTQTNKFAVLDRESIIDFAREKHLLLSENAPLEEKAKLAETLGADYLLVGTISEAKLDRKDKYLQATAHNVVEYKARFVLGYRLVMSTTKQIIFSGNAEKYLENEEIRALANERDPAEWDPAQIRDGIVSLIANDVAATIIDRLYPIRVASVQKDGQLILNQGGDKMSEGMLLDVFSGGEELFDSDTKESLGRVEKCIATAEIKKVLQKTSFAKVVDGDPTKISTGLVCRVRPVSKNYNTGMKPDVIRNDKGAVKLPFDK